MANVDQYNNPVNNEKMAKNISVNMLSINEIKGNNTSKYSTLSE